MIDYATQNRSHQLLGGLTAEALLWQGRTMDVDFTVDEFGRVTNICVVYPMIDDEYRIHVRHIQTKNDTRLFEFYAEWQGQRIFTRYLPDDTTEANFAKMYLLMRKRCRSQATAEIITQSP